MYGIDLICVLCFFFFEKLSHSDDHGLLHLPPALDIADRSVKLLNTHPTMTNHHHGLGRSIFLKQTRHYYGHQYFRRNSTNHANASSSRAKGISSQSKHLANVYLLILLFILEFFPSLKFSLHYQKIYHTSHIRKIYINRFYKSIL